MFTTIRKLSDDMSKLLDQVKRHEGFSGVPYKCAADKTTIGYGRNLESNPLTKEEATLLLDNDLRMVMYSLRDHKLLDGHNEARNAVIINMAFNLGVTGLLRFKKTLEYYRNGDYESASREMLDSKWARQVKGRAIELSKQMLTGEWQ